MSAYAERLPAAASGRQVSCLLETVFCLPLVLPVRCPVLLFLWQGPPIVREGVAAGCVAADRELFFVLCFFQGSPMACLPVPDRQETPVRHETPLPDRQGPAPVSRVLLSGSV